MKYPYRPILQIPKTKIEKVYDSVGIGLFLISLLYLAIQWGSLPEKIPGHFNAIGEVDRWGSKYELFILPIIGLFIFGLTSAFEKAPHMHNYPKRLNESNVEQFYLSSRKLLNITKNFTIVVFAVLNVQIVRIAKGEIQSLGNWFLPVFIGVLIFIIAYSLYKISKIK